MSFWNKVLKIEKNNLKFLKKIFFEKFLKIRKYRMRAMLFGFLAPVDICA